MSANPWEGISHIHREPGDRFGSLVLVSRSHQGGRHVWVCKCDCGAEVSARIDALTGGLSDCGCVTRKPEHHGMTNTRTYKSWSSMRTRCFNPNSVDYADYGGRGITVCERWRSFSLFLEDMGERPHGMTLDRKDPDSDYTPENCRWADAATQAKNKRGARKRVADQIDGAIADAVTDGERTYSLQEVVQLLEKLRRRVTGEGESK